MRTILTGTIVFVLWSALCTWYYVSHIKGAPAEEPIPVEEPVAKAPPTADTASVATVPEAPPESPGIYFVYHEFDRSGIIPDAEFDNYILRAVKFFEQTPGSGLDVTGHTDNIGSTDYNYSLGMRRAQSTRDYLVKRGMPADLIHTSSRGESEPAASNDTESGRAKNRRTEIHIIE